MPLTHGRPSPPHMLSIGHFQYNRLIAACQQKHDIKMHKNKPFILGILYNAILAALVALHGANYAGAIGI